MAIFLLTGMPLFALLVGAAALSGRMPGVHRYESAGDLAWQFLAGVVAALPAQVLLLLLRDIIGVSFRSGQLYFAVALVEQVSPLAVAVGCYLLIHLAPFFGRSRDSLSSSLELAVFLSGYFSILSVADFVGGRGELTAHALFLLPLARLTEIVIFARALPRLVQSQGWSRVVPGAAMASWPFLAAFGGMWFRQGRAGAAVVLTAGLFLCVAAGWLTVLRRPAR
jgi:hypothetical protein